MSELLGYTRILTTTIYITKYIYEAQQQFCTTNKNCKYHSFEIYKTYPGPQFYDAEAHTNRSTHSTDGKGLDI